MLSYIISPLSKTTPKPLNLVKDFEGSIKLVYNDIQQIHLISAYHADSNQWYEIGSLELSSNYLEEGIFLSCIYVDIKSHALPVFLNLQTVLFSLFANLLNSIGPFKLFDLYAEKDYILDDTFEKDKTFILSETLKESLKESSQFFDNASNLDIEGLFKGVEKFNTTFNHNLLFGYLNILRYENRMTQGISESVCKYFIENLETINKSEVYEHLAAKLLFVLTFTESLALRFILYTILPVASTLSPENEFVQELKLRILTLALTTTGYSTYGPIIEEHINELLENESFVFKPELACRLKYLVTGNSKASVYEYMKEFDDNPKLSLIRRMVRESYEVKTINTIDQSFYHDVIVNFHKTKLSFIDKFKLDRFGYKHGLVNTIDLKTKVTRSILLAILMIVPFAILFADYYSVSSKSDVIFKNTFLDGDKIAGVVLINLAFICLVAIPVYFSYKYLTERIKKAQIVLIKVFISSVLVFWSLLVVFIMICYPYTFLSLIWNSNQIKVLHEKSFDLSTSGYSYSDIKKAEFNYQNCGVDCRFIAIKMEPKSAPVFIIKEWIKPQNYSQSCQMFNLVERKLKESGAEITKIGGYANFNKDICFPNIKILNIK